MSSAWEQTAFAWPMAAPARSITPTRVTKDSPRDRSDAPLEAFRAADARQDREADLGLPKRARSERDKIARHGAKLAPAPRA
jgi:hypothetical protein